MTDFNIQLFFSNFFIAILWQFLSIFAKNYLCHKSVALMKRFLLLTITLVMLMAIAPIAHTHASDNISRTAMLRKQPTQNPEQPGDPKGRRSVQKPICDWIYKNKNKPK